jgi:hypothetical protein
MNPEQRDALCEYVDGQREAGRRYDEIADKLEGKLPEESLEKLEDWHRQWKKKQWRDELERQRTMVPMGETEFAAGETENEEWAVNGSRGEKEMIRYLAQRLIGREIVTDGGKIRWKPLYTRSLMEGQSCEWVKGAGQAGGFKWMHSAVVFRTGERIDHVEVEARIRRRVRPGSKRSQLLRLNREAVELEKLDLVREQLDHEEISARLAALLQTFLGKGSGIRSGAHLARLTNRTRQAVSARKLLIAEDYYAKTGGKAGFEGVTSAAKHRAKVIEKERSQN